MTNEKSDLKNITLGATYADRKFMSRPRTPVRIQSAFETVPIGERYQVIVPTLVKIIKDTIEPWYDIEATTSMRLSTETATRRKAYGIVIASCLNAECQNNTEASLSELRSPEFLVRRGIKVTPPSVLTHAFGILPTMIKPDTQAMYEEMSHFPRVGVIDYVSS
jgi:hypothetical protein